MSFSRRKQSLVKKAVYSKYFLVLGVIILVLISSALIRKILHDRRVNQDIEKLKEEIGILEETDNEFNELVNYLSSERFVEEEARITMGLGNIGEKVVIISPNEETISLEEEEGKNKLSVSSKVILGLPEEKEEKNTIKWWNYFFNK